MIKLRLGSRDDPLWWLVDDQECKHVHIISLTRITKPCIDAVIWQLIIGPVNIMVGYGTFKNR